MNISEYKAALLERIKIAEAATPGPIVVSHDPRLGDFAKTMSGQIVAFSNGPFSDLTVSKSNMEFVAQAGNHYLADLKALLAAVEALEQIIVLQETRKIFVPAGVEIHLCEKHAGIIRVVPSDELAVCPARDALEKITGEK